MARANSSIPRVLRESRALVKIALPVIVTQLAQNAMSFIDVIMAGRVSPLDLSAVALGSALWLPAELFIVGLLVILSAMIAHHHGRGELADVPRLTHQAAWLGALLGSLGLALTLAIAFNLHLVDTTAAIRAETKHYLIGIAFSLPAIGLFQALRCHSEGLSRPKPFTAIVILAMLANIPLNFVFIYGYGPIPAMGGAGCGWATSLVYFVALVLAWGYTRYRPAYPELALYANWHWPIPREIARIFRMGVPVGLAILFEVSLFSVVSVLVAQYGETVLAGHQIAYNMAAMTYMIPLGMGMAISVRVSFLLGKQQPDEAQRAAYTGVGIAVTIAFFTSLAFIFFRDSLPFLFTNNAQVTAIAAHFFILAAIFQFSDAIQASTAGALRGYHETRSIMLATGMAYWVVGLPVGYVLSKQAWNAQALGADGLWIGLIFGLTSAAMLLQWRLLTVSRRKLNSR